MSSFPSLADGIPSTGTPGRAASGNMQPSGHDITTRSVTYNDPRKPVARGGFGEVYRGRYKQSDGSEVEVAIKMFKGLFGWKSGYCKGVRDSSLVLQNF